MKSEVREISPIEREIHLQIDAESLKAAYGQVTRKFAQRASVPGFRKGFAPVDVVALRFRDEIRSEVLQQVIPEKVEAAIREHDLHPLSEPRLHLEDHENVKVNGSQPLSLHVHVEVMPEITTPEYEGIEVQRRVKPVTDDEVEGLIQERLQQETVLIPVEDRPSEIGDTVVADLEGTFADESDGEPIRADDLEVKLGDEVIERSFTENLVGVSADEEKEFTVSYPEDFSSTALAGKTVRYRARIKSVGRTELPELNDEWAQSLDEGYGSLDELRSRLRADLQKIAESDADARVRNEVIAKMIEKNPIEIPNALIENQARNLLNDFAEDLRRRGVDLEKVQSEFLRMAYQNMRTQAERDVRGALLLDKIAEIENISVSDEEVNNELQKMAEYYRASVEELRSSLEKQGGGEDSIRNNLKTRKAVEAVVAKARITNAEWTDKSAAESSTEEEPSSGEKPKKSRRAAKKS
jgi:trigger factor